MLPEDPTELAAFFLGRLGELVGRLEKQDDRNLSLMLAAYMEDILGSVLLHYLVDGASAKELVTGFNAPLGTFASRTRAAHALGLISDQQSRTLNLIRKIRNQFAHNWELESFDHPSIGGILDSMDIRHIGEAPESPTRRTKFENTSGAILLELQFLNARVQTERLQSRPLQIGNS